MISTQQRDSTQAIQQHWIDIRQWLDGYVIAQLGSHPEIVPEKLRAMIDNLEAISYHFPEGLESPEAFGNFIRDSALWSVISSSWISLYNEDVFKACKSILGRFCKRGNWDDDTVEELTQSAWMEVFKTAHILITLPESERKKQIVDIAFSVSNKYKNSETKRKKIEVPLSSATYKDDKLVYDPKKGIKKPEIEPEELPEPEEPEPPKAVRVIGKNKTIVAKQARTDGKFQLALADRPMSLDDLVHIAATREQVKDKATAREVKYSLKRIGAILVNGLYELPEPQLTQAKEIKKALEKFQRKEALLDDGVPLEDIGDAEDFI